MSALRSLFQDLKSKPEIRPLAVLLTFASCFGIYTVYYNVFLRADQVRSHEGLSNYDAKLLERGQHYDAVAQLLQREGKEKEKSQ